MLDQRPSSSAKLQKVIAQEIVRVGPIPFSRYMELALYSEEGGYYTRNIPGALADFTTAPAISPVFGQVLARKLEGLWSSIGSPRSFTLTEVGAGGGDLALSVWKSANGALHDALRFRFVERHQKVEEYQRRRMEAQQIPSSWVRSLNELTPEPGCVLANELIDNFEFDIFEVSDRGLLQLFVSAREGSFSEHWGPAEDHEVEKLADGLEPGTRFEVHRRIDDFSKGAYAAIDRGYLLVIDYGDEGSLLRRTYGGGTAVTYRGEVLDTDLLAAPGENDITAHVDFTPIRAACISAGFDPMPIQTQRQFLIDAGILEILDSLKEEADRAAAMEDHSTFLEKTAGRSKAATLINGPLGDFKVLLARKG